MNRRLLGIAWVALAGLAGALLAPWIRVGSAGKSTLDLIAGARAVGVLEGRGRAGVIAVWLVVPLALAVTTVALALHRWRSAVVAMVIAGVVGLGLSALTLAELRPVALWGAYAAVVCGIVTVAAAVLAVVPVSRRG